ncbi:MAG: dihydrolipoamide acetyltransferase family protein [Opitutales bacterium]|jgi:pyruvate dehydrogenase E2 component (dihydrolipoamide acetyltransferase)
MAEIIEMPKLSDTMTTGSLVKWLKQEGEPVSSGDMIAEVETDKATMEVECFEDGVLLKHYIKEGDSLEVGGPICAVGEKGEEAPEVEIHTSETPSMAGPEVEPEEAPEPEAASETKQEATPKAETTVGPATTAMAEGARVKVSPLARKVAEELGIDIARLKGSGPGGRIVRTDVEEAAKNPQSMAAHAGSGGPAIVLGKLEEKSEKVTNMRASIAKALVKSKTEAPHFYLQSEVNAAPLAAARKDLNDFLAGLPAEEGGIKYTVNDLILRASAMAVRMVPAINRSWGGTTITQHGAVHLAFGVAIDDGLVTPVIRNADTKSLRQISVEAKDLIVKARNRKLTPDEMSGSTLTVTNLGMFGITDFYGIINPNNAAILSIGATVKQPVVDENNNITIGYRMKVGLSGDHRVIDGAVGAQYLQALGTLLEKPAILLA